jgi:hypothetical protein
MRLSQLELKNMHGWLKMNTHGLGNGTHGLLVTHARLRYFKNNKNKNKGYEWDKG